jgi:hypothetical protein
MLSTKNVWTYGMIVITFVFLPPENWDYWFLAEKVIAMPSCAFAANSIAT